MEKAAAKVKPNEPAVASSTMGFLNNVESHAPDHVADAIKSGNTPVETKKEEAPASTPKAAEPTK